MSANIQGNPLKIVSYLTPAKIIAIATAIAGVAMAVVQFAQGNWMGGISALLAALGITSAAHSAGTPGAPRVTIETPK
jgi:purine-cytosine permease-like protein